jgi:oligopeptidase B
VPGYDPAAYATERAWVTAPDGERVPVTFAYRIGARRPGGNPCLLYGYGAYERCALPRFSPTYPSLLDRGYVYAIAHVRGGGEGGRRWWLDGRLGHKHHTFTDFVAVRDWLVAAGWAAPGRVAGRGLSAGGLLTGAAYTFWPERWSAIIAEAPAVDLLNQMLDPTVPLTVNEYDEWGDPNDPEQFEWIRAYSPYENLSDGPKPPLLVTATMFDPRVAVYEPAKWVAALRARDTHGNDILLRAELGPGAHKGPSGRRGTLSYEAELLAWLLSRRGKEIPI